MVTDLTYSHDFILTPKVSTLVSLVDYQDKDRLITSDTPNYVDGSFHTTCTRGFGAYGSEIYLAVPSCSIACPCEEEALTTSPCCEATSSMK
jgi:hypothetical protein